MYLLYLDEAGSIHNKDEGYFVLGGFAVFERQIFFITERLERLAEDIWPENPAGVEFRASDIFSGRKAPWRNLHKNRRRDVIGEVLDIIAQSHESTRAFASAIHKESFPSDDQTELAFEDVCKRFDSYLQRIYKRENNPQRGIIVLGKSSIDKPFVNMARGFKREGTRWGALRNIAEVPFFVGSDATRLLQLADCVAYSVFRRYNALDASYFDIIVNRFDEFDGTIHGLAHKHNLQQTCYCPACLSRRLRKDEAPPAKP